MHPRSPLLLAALVAACADTSRPMPTVEAKPLAPQEKKEAAKPAEPPPPTNVPPRGLLKVIGSTGSNGTYDQLLGGDLGTGGEGKFGKAEVKGIGGLGVRGIGVGGGGTGAAHGLMGGRFAREPANTERYQHTGVNGWTLTEKDTQSTFAIDVDTASYALARRKLGDGRAPPPDSVRVEEWLNAFTYQYPQPPEGSPFAVFMDAAPSPLSAGKHLLRVGVQGRRVPKAQRQPAHLTFLVDVSGSMDEPDRLPLAKRALHLLVDELDGRDTVALVTYAGNTRLVLRPTNAARKGVIHDAIDELSAHGSTAMESGIELAYAQALRTLDGQSSSRVIVLSDGDANVGATGHQAILRKIRGHVQEGVTLTTVGFGVGNYHSELMEQLADQGNGNHVYVDSLHEARRVFVEQLGATLEVIAQDVKLQLEFDPRQVNAYRLVGYENRDVADREFRNDRVDGGELGAGHTVTALYELDLKAGAADGLVTVRVRAKRPRGVAATEQAFVFDRARLAPSFDAASADLRFATAVMGVAEVARRSPWAAEWSLERLGVMAKEATAGREDRAQFVELVTRLSSVTSARAGR